MHMRALLSLILLCLAVPAWAQAPAGPTLAAVKARGLLECSASLGTTGFGIYDRQGVFQGMDADNCRAIPAAVFGEPKVRFNALSTPQRLTALQTGQVDLVIQTLTWTQSREAANGLEFPLTYFYDGQSFLVRKSSGANSAKDLTGAAICTTQGS